MRQRLVNLVRRVRLWRQKVGLWLRPAREWDGRHDPVVERFGTWEGVSDGRYRHDFLGVRTDPDVRWGYEADPAGPVTKSPPGPTQAYFELIVALRAAVEAAGRPEPFVVAELGAGYGLWLVNAAAALRRLDPAARVSLIAVEPDPHHFEWLRRHLADNDIDPDVQRLLHGAVGGRSGTIGFVPSTRPDVEYGASVTEHGRQGSVALPSYSLDRTLDGIERVDLLHVDVQGAEWELLRDQGALLDERVRRLVVATHSRRIHRRVCRLVRDLGWQTEFEFGFRARERTAFGDVWFVDGMVAAVNPRVAAVQEPSS